MGIISRHYIKEFVCRYDKEVGVPYYSHLDFDGLKQEKFVFTNSQGVEIHCFYYYYDNYRQDKIIFFIHGLGPGHTSYLAEIELLARHGYKVLTYDATGCGESGGKYLKSLNEPTRDALELLDYLKLNKEIVLMGHSMGGFTSLNVINKRKDITKAIIISGFLSIVNEVSTVVKNKIIINGILKYEKKVNPECFALDNIAYLKNTTDKLFFIHSDNDTMVPYHTAMKIVEEIANPCIKTLLIPNRKHNPNYTDDAVNYMDEVFGNYYYLIKQKKIKTDEDKINYFKDVPIAKLVEQDLELFDKIFAFIEE